MVKLSLFLFSLVFIQTVSANNLIIDDRSSDELRSSLGTEWRLITDNVMGGVSSGSLTVDNYQGKKCLRMRGTVSTENNGGFVQISLPLSTQNLFDASAYTGIELEVAGNNGPYNIHFRSSGLMFPWQSYRASFDVSPEWHSALLASVVTSRQTCAWRRLNFILSKKHSDVLGECKH
jgi:hypothetical protein